jgi:hypothetical protein
MRPGYAAVLALLLGCNSGGTSAGATDGGTDATTSSGDGGSAGDDAASDAPEEPMATPCIDLDASLPVPSSDCVYAGNCPAVCNMGTASAYLCVVGPDASLTYPAVFSPPPVDSVDIIGFEPDAYPWDTAAYLSCAALTCTRWATADHVDGGSAWPGDPCGPTDSGAEDGSPADAGPSLTTQAWACPTLPGLAPALAGCIAAGDLQRIGGPGTGIPVNAVWCCPPPGSTEAGSPEDEGGTGDAGGD